MEVLSLPASAAGMSSTCLAPCAPPATLAPTTTAAAAAGALEAAAEPAGHSCDSCSLASTSTEQHCSADGLDPSQRTHHLLKHCLSQSQRVTALAHFNTADPREAAKEIARMGQRELQAKFKEVYGSATKSNNNSWLRRKLYEAVGVAPLKANTKGKARKGAGSGSGGSRKSAHSSKDGGGAAKARSPKLAAIKVKRGAEAACPSPQRQHPRLPLSGGPLSILDLHQHSALSNDTSDSEDADSHCHASHPPRPHHSCPSSPTSPLAFCGSAIFAMQQQAMAGSLPGRGAPAQRACPLPLAPAGFVPVAEPQSPLAGLHWADGFPAAPAQQQAASAAASGAAANFLASGSQSLAGVEADLNGFSSAFKPMELDQEPGSLWDGDAEPQPWYFGSGLDLTGLALPKSLPMGCSGGAATGCDDDDDVPLLTLDLGAIDVSI